MPDGLSSATITSRRSLWWLDTVAFILLCALSVLCTLKYTHGDLWLDEADYAVAGLHSVHDNRWDRSDKPDQSDLLVRLRHFHAPATAIILKIAHGFGSDEETLRRPFVIAGALSVGLVYLCGIALFGDRREIAAGCALLTAITPANIRMASHAVPWSLIIFELLWLLLAVIRFAQFRRPWQLIWIGFDMGLLFVTSETFFVAAAALVVVFPIILAPELAQYARRRHPKKVASDQADSTAGLISGRSLLRGAAGGAAAFVIVALFVWPAGLAGHCLVMLRHYIDMRTTDAFPVNIGSQVYQTAPKWAYLYWYSMYFRPFFLCYLAGLVVVLAIVVSQVSGLMRLPAAGVLEGAGSRTGRQQANAAILLLFTFVLLAAAHRAHIIGAEYLAHCLPFMALCAGYAVLVISQESRLAGMIAILVAGIVFVRWSPTRILPGMDARTQIARWREAATAIGPLYEPEDRLLLGPQSSNVAYWYLHEWAKVPMYDWQIGQFALAGPGPNFLHNLSIGKYRWVVISSQFEDNVINAVDPRSMQILGGWSRVLVSDEKGLGPPRLTVFRCPLSFTHLHGVHGGI